MKTMNTNCSDCSLQKLTEGEKGQWLEGYKDLKEHTVSSDHGSQIQRSLLWSPEHYCLSLCRNSHGLEQR